MLVLCREKTTSLSSLYPSILGQCVQLSKGLSFEVLQKKSSSVIFRLLLPNRTLISFHIILTEKLSVLDGT